MRLKNLSATCHRRPGRSCGTNSVLTQRTHVNNDEVLRKCNHYTQDTQPNYSATFRAAAIAAGSYAAPHGSNRPKACVTLLELRATPLRRGVLLRSRRARRRKQQVLLGFCAALRAQIARPDGLSQPALARSRMVFCDPKLGRNVVIPAATVTASSAMHRATGKTIF